ncbi:MAG: GspE/PulE family protein [Longimicrobiales bacterium]
MIQPTSPRVLGKLLLAERAISEAELAAALQEQRTSRERLGEILIRRGTDPEHIARALAQQLRLPYAQPPLRPEASALKVVSRALATRLKAVPLTVQDKVLRVAVVDPLDLAALDDLGFQTSKRVQPLVASGPAVQTALGAYDADAVAQLVQRIPTRSVEVDDDVAALQRASEAPPIVGLVEHLLQQSVTLGASDVHIEPCEGVLRVRVRVDGLLTRVAELPTTAAAAVVSRLKVMGGLDIASKRVPQDGRATVRVQGRTYALRMSTLPTQNGEKVVLRILDPENSATPLEQLGMGDCDLTRLRLMLESPHGLILVTGPTGSGKTTTLYAALASLDRERRNLITLEDPVEYRLPGITQVQVHARAGLGFATSLRAVLRQDPDVIMVGELRDQETVEVALAAAATGHLVLSTLHTNDAPSTVSRLLNMGAPPYLLASALIGVMAQRLVRRVCVYCASVRDATVQERAQLGGITQLAEAVGCSSCLHGYRGRTGAYEVMVVSAAQRELIARGAPADELRNSACAEGMKTLALDALRLLQSGVTTAQEVRPFLAGLH